MNVHEKKALQPFLYDDHASDDSRDGSLELPELTPRGKEIDQHTDDSRPSTSGDDGSKGFSERPRAPTKPATYAIMFMLGAQVFSASMNVSIRLLENASTHLHPLQVRTSVADPEGMTCDIRR